MNGNALRHALEQLSAIADTIAERDLVLTLTSADFLANTNVAIEDADTVTEAFMRGVAALERYRDICESPDAPRTHDVDRYLAARAAGEGTRIDSIKIARFARQLTSGLAEAAATALDEEPDPAPATADDASE